MLIGMDLTTSLPIGQPIRNLEGKNRRRDEAGFAESPRVLEIQLPVKIATKEDLIAWAKYVMGLMASKINITLSSVKEELSRTTDQNRLKKPFKQQTSSQTSSRFTDIKSKEPLQPPPRLNSVKQNNNFLPQYPNFGTRNTYDLNDEEVIRNTNDVIVPPAATYLPVPVTNPGIDSRYRQQEQSIGNLFFDNLERNLTSNNFGLNTFHDDLSLKKFLNNPVELSSPIRFNNFTTLQRNLTDPILPLISVPFEAVITITREQSTESTIPPNKTKNLLVIPKRDPPDEFPPYFERNYTLIDQDGQINVIFDDFVTRDNNNGSKKNVRQETEKEKDEKRRQPTMLGELLQLLQILRKNSQNDTNAKITTSISKIIKGMKPQKVQIAPAYNEVILLSLFFFSFFFSFYF